MAEIQAAPGVKLGRFPWADFYTGTKDALIRAAIARPEWFLDGAQRNKKGQVVRKVRAVQNGLRVEVVQPAKGPCSVQIECSPEERAERERQAEEEDRSKRTERLERLCAEERQREMLAAIAKPGGVQNLAQQYLDGGVPMIMAAFNLTERLDLPFSFPDKTRQKAEWHLRELMALLEDGGIQFRPGALLQGDADFQRFMQRATLPAGAR